MIRARDIFCMLIGAVLGTIAVSRAVDFEIAVGRTEFCCLQDGVWWQSQFGFNGSVRDGSIEIGARQRIGDFSIHGAYLDLGVANGLNAATMRDDDFGSFSTSKSCDTAKFLKNCLGYFAVKQRVAGVLVGGAYRKPIRGVLVEGEVGQYFYKSDMNVSIWCPTCGPGVGAFGAGGTYSYASDIRRSPYVAVKVGFKDWFVTVRRFSNIDGGGKSGDGQFATALTNGPVNQIMLGMAL